jgi:dTMP kinase
LLYLSARSENIELIKKNIRKKIILIDRFSDSTIAYQHYGMGVNLKFIENINNFLLKGIKVDCTILSIVNQKNMKKRLTKRNNLNRYDKFNSNFYEKVQKGFKKILNKNPKKYMLIDSNLDIAHNEKIILDKINSLI